MWKQRPQNVRMTTYFWLGNRYLWYIQCGNPERSGYFQWLAHSPTGVLWWGRLFRETSRFLLWDISGNIDQADPQGVLQRHEPDYSIVPNKIRKHVGKKWPSVETISHVLAAIKNFGTGKLMRTTGYSGHLEHRFRSVNRNLIGYSTVRKWEVQILFELFGSVESIGDQYWKEIQPIQFRNLAITCTESSTIQGRNILVLLPSTKAIIDHQPIHV